MEEDFAVDAVVVIEVAVVVVAAAEAVINVVNKDISPENALVVAVAVVASEVDAAVSGDSSIFY